MNKTYFKIKNVGRVFVEGKHLSVHYNNGRVMDEYDLLASAADMEDWNVAKSIISFIDRLIPSENYTYNILRSQVFENHCLLNAIDRRVIDERMRKTYLMTDSETGATKIGRSINPPKRERTLQAEKKEISLLMVCDKDVEKQLHKQFETKHIRGEWYNLSENDINDIIKQYNFKPYANNNK